MSEINGRRLVEYEKEDAVKEALAQASNCNVELTALAHRPLAQPMEAGQMMEQLSSPICAAILTRLNRKGWLRRNVSRLHQALGSSHEAIVPLACKFECKKRNS